MIPKLVDPKLESWASDPEAWDQNSGMPGISLFANALQVWSMMQDHNTSLTEAATVFNVSVERIREAVEYHYWMFVDHLVNTGEEIIGHEGE